MNHYSRMRFVGYLFLLSNKNLLSEACQSCIKEPGKKKIKHMHIIDDLWKN